MISQHAALLDEQAGVLRVACGDRFNTLACNIKRFQFEDAMATLHLIGYLV